MAMMATCEMVSVPAVTTSDLEAAVDELASLQKRAAEIERRARVLRAEVKEGLARRDLRKFVTSCGKTATIVVSTSWRGDKEAADKLLSPEAVATIFRSTTSIGVRVK
jgi:hypothetical protein